VEAETVLALLLSKDEYRVKLRAHLAKAYPCVIPMGHLQISQAAVPALKGKSRAATVDFINEMLYSSLNFQ